MPKSKSRLDILRSASAADDYNAVAKPWADKLIQEREGAEVKQTVAECLMVDAMIRNDDVFAKKATREFAKQADIIEHAEDRAGAIIEAPDYIGDPRCIFIRNVMVQDLRLNLASAKVFKVFRDLITGLPEDRTIKLRRDRLRKQIMTALM
jgi:hypothetical protein